MKSRKVLIALVGVIVVAVFGFYVFSSKSVNSLVSIKVKENPQGVVFVPKQSPLMVSLLINPQKLASVTQFLPANQESKKIMTVMDKLRSTLLTQAQVDSLEDLKGWIDDEVTFAVTSLDYDHNSDNGSQPGYLLAVKNNDRQAASEFLQTYYNKDVISDTSELIFDEYEGVKIVYQHPLSEKSPVKQVAAAVVGDYVLFANDLPVLIDALNNAQAVELNLNHDTVYQNALQSLPPEKVTVVYLNLPSTSAWITKQPEVSSPNLKSLTLSLQLNQQGLVTHTAFFTGAEEDKKPTLTQPPQTLAYVPSSSVFAIAGMNLQALGENLAQGLETHNPFAEIASQIITPLESSLELNFQEDIFAQVTGEYALSLSAQQDKPSFDWLFVNQVNDEPLSPNFDRFAQQRGLSIGDLPLEDDTMTTWTKLITSEEAQFSTLQAEVKGVHSQVDSYEILTSSVELLSESIQDSDSSLLASSDFPENITVLPSANNGYLYLQWQPLKPYLVARFPLLRIVEFSFKPLFDNLNSVTLTNEGVTEGMEISTVFLKFAS